MIHINFASLLHAPIYSENSSKNYAVDYLKKSILTKFQREKKNAQVFHREFLFKDQLHCPASFCHQKAPSVKQQSVLLFSEVLKTADQVQPSVPSTVFKDKDKAHAATNIFHTHFNPRIYQNVSGRRSNTTS